MTPPWIIRYEGPGYCLSESADTEPGAYQRARAQAVAAQAGNPIAATLRIGGQQTRLADVGRIWILRRDETSGHYRPHSHSWFSSEPCTSALTPLPDDF